MIPKIDYYNDGVYINDLKVVQLFCSNGRPRSRGNGFAMWTYDFLPLGWVENGSYLIECVTAALLVRGQLTPRWQQVPTGLRLMHPQYTLNVKQSSNGWVPSISDELGRSHSLKARATTVEAVNLLDNLLRRRVGRENPAFEPQWWFDPSHKIDQAPEFRLGLRLIGPDISVLIRNTGTKNHWSDQELVLASELAKLLDYSLRHGLDELPRLATILATFIKFVLIDIYRGAKSVVLDQAGHTLAFSSAELAAFRDRFRHSPMTDKEYLDFVDNHFTSRLQGLRCKYRVPKSSIVGLRLLHPQRDKDDFLMPWPRPPGTRLFEVMKGREPFKPDGGVHGMAN